MVFVSYGGGCQFLAYLDIERERQAEHGEELRLQDENMYYLPLSWFAFLTVFRSFGTCATVHAIPPGRNGPDAE